MICASKSMVLCKRFLCLCMCKRDNRKGQTIIVMLDAQLSCVGVKSEIITSHGLHKESPTVFTTLRNLDRCRWQVLAGFQRGLSKSSKINLVGLSRRAISPSREARRTTATRGQASSASLVAEVAAGRPFRYLYQHHGGRQHLSRPTPGTAAIF